MVINDIIKKEKNYICKVEKSFFCLLTFPQISIKLICV